jgi:putative MATE family efflux protein
MNPTAPVQPADVTPSDAEADQSTVTIPLEYSVAPPKTAPSSTRGLFRELIWLALPVFAEQVLHMFVGVNDTWLANHVVRLPASASAQQIAHARSEMAAAAAAVGSVSYIMWFIGLVSGAVGTGATAIIARATGARHRSLANGICGQAISAAAIVGAALFVAMLVFTEPLANATGLQGRAHDFALLYFRMLGASIPFVTVMFVANACLRGAGDTRTPAITFVFVDVINMVLSYALTYGALGLPKMGFAGIAAGTVIAFIFGGVTQTIVLLRGRGGIRLYVHRLAPHWHHLKRLVRIGLPAGVSDTIQWLANFAMIVVINQMDESNVSSAAHNNTIKIEGFSYLAGFAVMTAVATMVGQSLGMRDPRRATRSAYLGYAVGGGFMTLMGLAFITLGWIPARILSDDPRVIDLTTTCLFITGWCQCGFAAAMIFGGALRGAGDTFKVMLLNLTSVIGVRFGGVMVVTLLLHKGLAAVWIVLAAELLIRGALMYGRFVHGGWKRIEV